MEGEGTYILWWCSIWNEAINDLMGMFIEDQFAICNIPMFTLSIPFAAPAIGAGEAQVAAGTLCQSKVSVDSSPGLKDI